MENLYPETTEEAAQIARAALPLASRFQLPANPINYAVLYEYVSGHNPRLQQAADAFIQQRNTLSQELIQDLYSMFLAPQNEESLRQFRQSLRQILLQATDSLSRADQDASQYQESLQQDIQRLDQDIGIEEIRGIIGHVIENTRNTLDSGRQLRQQLDHAQQELEQLRREFDRVRSESVTDPLTGIANRRCFDRRLEELAHLTGNGNAPLTLLLVDIDHFKGVNDTFGHVVGDEILRYVARILQDCTRGGDLVARYGGEEFAVLLPDTGLSGAEQVAGNICGKLRQAPLQQKSTGRSIGTVTVSVGIALYRRDEPLDVFVARADVALYQAKEAGRDRICLDRSEPAIQS